MWKIERYAIVENGETINVILWDGMTPLTLPEGQTLVLEKDAPKYNGVSDVIAPGA